MEDKKLQTRRDFLVYSAALAGAYALTGNREAYAQRPEAIITAVQASIPEGVRIEEGKYVFNFSTKPILPQETMLYGFPPKNVEFQVQTARDKLRVVSPNITYIDVLKVLNATPARRELKASGYKKGTDSKYDILNAKTTDQYQKAIQKYGERNKFALITEREQLENMLALAEIQSPENLKGIPATEKGKYLDVIIPAFDVTQYIVDELMKFPAQDSRSRRAFFSDLGRNLF